MTLSAATTGEAARHAEARMGFIYALAAYAFWGFLPFFLKAVGHLPTSEVVAHRIIWSLPIAAGTILATRRGRDIMIAVRSWRMLGMASLTAAALTVNWGVYVWAIANGKALEGALGYYINPLFSVFLASVVLGERLTAAQLGAIALAACAVALLSWETGGLPYVSLVLAGSWGVYALLKKLLPLGPNQGFFLEVLLLCPFALAYLVWLNINGAGHFGPTGWTDVLLLLMAGPVTAVPLIFYANGAKRLKLSTIALMQYIAPTMVFLEAVLVFGEPLRPAHAVTFGLIWLACALYAWDSWRAVRGA